MAKKVNTDEIDERLILQSVRKDRIAQEIVPPPLVPLPAVVPVHTESNDAPPIQAVQIEDVPASVSPPEPQKDDNKRKRNKQDYETLFIKEVQITARLGKTVYIRKEFHDRILKIVQVIGGNEVSLFSYIDNISASVKAI
jgi:hypothetical protein